MVEFNIFAKLASPPPPRKQHSETPVAPDTRDMLLRFPKWWVEVVGNFEKKRYLCMSHQNAAVDSEIFAEFAPTSPTLTPICCRRGDRS